jgi:Protein of unknown function (DUF3071)
MQELRLVAVSEDGSYVVLTAPGSGGRFSLPIDDRLRIVARGQFSRLAQYEIEVESPLRPKEIQDRIRAGETADEIADAAGLPIERVRRFEGPVLAERAYRAQEALGASLRYPGDSPGPGRRLGDVVAERLRAFGSDPEEAEWDSRKRPDGDWVVQLAFAAEGRPYLAEWLFDPRRRHISPADDTATRLCLPDAELSDGAGRQRGRAPATVTPIGSRLGPGERDGRHPGERRQAERPQPERPQPERQGTDTRRATAQAQPAAANTATAAVKASRAATEQAAGQAQAGAADQESGQAGPATPPPRQRAARKVSGGRSRRSSVPSWDEIMFGTSRNHD